MKQIWPFIRTTYAESEGYPEKKAVKTLKLWKPKKH